MAVVLSRASLLTCAVRPVEAEGWAAAWTPESPI